MLRWKWHLTRRGEIDQIGTSLYAGQHGGYSSAYVDRTADRTAEERDQECQEDGGDQGRPR